MNFIDFCFNIASKIRLEKHSKKCKADPLQVWTGPEGG
jgi:hypothetical protein